MGLGGNTKKICIVTLEFCFILGIDLALLSQANHSVLTYGTFGMWGALFAGGETVMPNSHRKTKEYLEVNEAKIPGWIFI